jgi:hypothetical protein
MTAKRITTVCSLSLVILAAAIAYAATQRGLGYTDTPIIPGTNWHVHDGDRPQPPIVTPGETFSHNAAAPSDAVVLFDGKDLSKWQTSNGRPATWRVDNAGFMESGRGGIRTKDKFADFQLHLEFATPSQVSGTGQGRGNSGILINGMYEVQLLDSYDNKTYPDGQCGAIYGQTPPLVNACKAPGQWQTYDIIFESPRWDAEGKLVKNANVTVLQNGLVLHHKRDYFGATDGIGGVAHTALGAYRQRHEPEVFIELQDHSNPIRFRNIWARPLGEYDKQPVAENKPQPTEAKS